MLRYKLKMGIKFMKVYLKNLLRRLQSKKSKVNNNGKPFSNYLPNRYHH